VREDDADRRIPVQDAVEYELDTGSRGLEREVRHGRGNSRRRREGWLSWGVARVFEYDGVAAVEFGPQRLERWISEVLPRVAGHEDYSVGVQCAQRIPEFLNGAADVRKGQRREAAEPVGPVGDQVCGVFVDATCHLPPFGLGPAHDAGRADRQDPGRDLLGVHEVERALR
jgi:hypothetical protein